MKRRLRGLIALVMSAFSICWAGPAELHLHSTSVRFQPGAASANALNYQLQLTTGSPEGQALNGELAPVPANASASHGAFYQMTGDIIFEPVFGTLFVDVPPSIDANTNGIPDFFDISEPVSGVTTAGTFQDMEQTGKITAVWNRTANAKDGLCRLTLEGYNLTFAHAFEIIEFSGSLNYSSTTTNVTGSVQLAKVLEPERTFSGLLQLRKLGPDLLRMENGAWKNDTGLGVAYQVPEDMARAGQRFTSDFFFRDGDPASPEEDFLFWIVRIVDPNDRNGNGVPDISDEEAIARLPALGIMPGSSTNVLLTISGDIGKRHQIEQSPTLAPAKWVNVIAPVLTNDPQTVSVPVRGAPLFWRVRVP